MDLWKRRYASFGELERYCELVAVTISEISLAIFGAGDPRAAAAGRSLALALQLTNMCRDVGEDVGRGRIYLPLDELARFGVGEEDLLAARVDTPAYRALMAFECERAREYFRAARGLPRAIARDSRSAVRVMGGVYRRVLDRIDAAPVAAFSRRVELPRWQRLITVAAGVAGLPFAGAAGGR